jgi:hypothetical protein
MSIHDFFISESVIKSSRRCHFQPVIIVKSALNDWNNNREKYCDEKSCISIVLIYPSGSNAEMPCIFLYTLKRIKTIA